MDKVNNDINSDSCPLCCGQRSMPLFSVGTSYSKFSVIRCLKCGLARTSPLPTDETLRIHDISTYYGNETNKFIPVVQKIRDRLMRIRSGYYLSLVSNSVRTPKILDIGCAEGRLLKSFLDYGCKCWGVEHPGYPAERFLNIDQIAYFQGDLGSIDLEEGSFDLIFLWHVLEHMDDPGKVIERLHRLLAPEGYVVLAVPNFSSLEAKAFKQFWFHLDIPWHKYHFNEKSLRYLTEKNRFRIIKNSTLCFEQGPYGLLQSILNAMRFPGNVLYEAIKGNPAQRRSILLLPQILLAVPMLVPVFLVSIAMSILKRGSVIELILKKL